VNDARRGRRARAPRRLEATRPDPDPGATRRVDPDPEAPARRRRPDRVGDLLPDVARRLGLESELRLARAIATWDALVAERVPPAAGACRLVRLEPDTVVVEADEPIVAGELRLRALELLAAFAGAPGGVRAHHLQLVAPGSGPGTRPGQGRRV
jgi:predicted nucleic acid-binding Zn ribbon protein